MNASMKGGGPPWDDEALLAWLLDGETRGRHPRAELERDARRAARLADYEAFLADCRAELKAEAPGTERPGELERAVLARTTREDVSWRGDLRLVGGFLRSRLRSSVLLRVVAASLLLHLAALPVLAYLGWVAPEPTPHIAFELPAERAGELPFREDESDAARLPVEAPGDSLDEEAALDSLAGGVDRERLWTEHLQRRGAAELDGLSGPLAPETVRWPDDLGLVLRCELLLDRLGRADRGDARASAAQLEFALGELRALLERPEGPGDGGALRELAASAWLRARAAGRGAEDPQLSARCRARLAPRLESGEAYLRGAAWRAAYARAE